MNFIDKNKLKIVRNYFRHSLTKYTFVGLIILTVTTNLSDNTFSNYRKLSSRALYTSNKDSKTFRNIFNQSGLSVEINQNSVAWADYNNDGYLDLLIISMGRSLKLYRNTGAGNFVDVTKLSGIKPNGVYAAAAFGDYDNDGCLDLYLSRYDSDALYHNNCDGTFTDVTNKARIHDSFHGSGLSWVDFNRDGFLDIYVTSHGTGESKTFTPEPNILYRNNGDGTFTDVTKQAGVSGYAKCPNLEANPLYANKQFPPLKHSFQSIWADFNGDGWPDLYVTNDAAVDVFYLNNKDGTFTESTYSSGLCNWTSGMGITAGDFNNDGYLDLYLTNSGPNFLYKNNGHAKFTEIAKESGVADKGNGWGTEFLDYDNDGWLDLLVVNGTWPDEILKHIIAAGNDRKLLDINAIARLFKNTGDGKFLDVSGKVGIDTVVGKNKMSAAIADYNNDGFVDMFITQVNDRMKVPGYLYQNTPNNNHWITFKLVGTKSNRDAIGARISLKTGAGTQTREVVSGSSFFGQSSLWPTFGLGEYERVEQVEIRWPSGIIQTIKNLKSNQVLTIMEDK